MPDQPTDAQIARLLAEAMGVSIKNADTSCSCDTCMREARRLTFDPANDWRDFGRVWEWADENKLNPGIDVTPGHHREATAWWVGPPEHDDQVYRVAVSDGKPPQAILRAFCLALCRALGVVE